MAKRATVLSIVPTAAIAAAPTGLECPKIIQITFDEAMKRYGAQLEKPEVSQRLHEEQVDAGLWEHLATPVSTQATLEAVVIQRKGARKNPRAKSRLIDGFHRLFYWFKKGACPFKQLNIIIHTIEVDSMDDVDELIDALARTINSKNSVKRNTDFLTAAVREADPDYKAVSKAYRLGLRSVSYLKRTIGDPAKLSGPKLKAAVKVNLAAHKVMDKLFHFAESDRNVKPHLAQVLHTGIATAIFESITKLSTDAARYDALVKIQMCLVSATTAEINQKSSTAKPPYKALVEALRQMSVPAVYEDLVAKGGNREGFYTQVSKFMSPALVAINKAANRKK